MSKTLKEIEKKVMLVEMIPFVGNPFVKLSKEEQFKNFMIKKIKEIKSQRDEEVRKETIKEIKKLRKELEGDKICEKCGRKMVLNYAGEIISKMKIEQLDEDYEINVSCPKYFEYEENEKEEYDTFVEGHSDEVISDELKYKIGQIIWIKHFFNITEKDLK